MSAVETFELVLVLLATVIALHWLARRLGFPPSAALLVGGGALAFLPGAARRSRSIPSSRWSCSCRRC